MRIAKLKIYTSNLEQQLQFYRQVMELEVLQTNADSFEVKLGFSVLEFLKRDKATPYHIAFHIEANKEEQALSWLKERVGILTDDGKEIVDFPAWNARSVYFYDADENILEFISRRHCYPGEEEKFAPDSIKGISEIGLATSEVQRNFDFLNREFGLKKYTGDYEVFCATGDDEGLFIIINKEKKKWFPAEDMAYASPFEININRNGRISALSYNNERLELL